MGGFIVKSKAEDLLLWEQQINERIRSGLTVDKWCKKNGFNRHKYYYWDHRISKNQKSDKRKKYGQIRTIPYCRTINVVGTNSVRPFYQ